MNNKHARTFLKFYKKVVLSTTFIFSLGLLSTVQAQQSVVDNPMLPSTSVRYGSYSNSVSRVPSQPVTTAPTQTKTSKSTKKEASTGTVNINSASETELVGLPGIGPSKAKAIAEYRQSQGSFKSIDDLQKVKGIGPATLEKLRAHVTV
ncbi:MAG TPA: ComEA family DNA-binding protein [Aquirhabdus sp.]